MNYLVSISTNGGDQSSITASEIIYALPYDQGTMLRCTNNRTFFSFLALSAFEDLENTLFRCHRSRIININRIRRINTSVELDEGHIVPLSRRRRRSIISAFCANTGLSPEEIEA